MYEVVTGNNTFATEAKRISVSINDMIIMHTGIQDETKEGILAAVRQCSRLKREVNIIK